MFRALYALHQEVKIVSYNICMLYDTIFTSWWWVHSARNT